MPRAELAALGGSWAPGLPRPGGDTNALCCGCLLGVVCKRTNLVSFLLGISGGTVSWQHVAGNSADDLFHVGQGHSADARGGKDNSRRVP